MIVFQKNLGYQTEKPTLFEINLLYLIIVTTACHTGRRRQWFSGHETMSMAVLTGQFLGSRASILGEKQISILSGKYKKFTFVHPVERCIIMWKDHLIFGEIS